MRRYAEGDRVEVLKTKGTLEDLWHPAQITDGYDNVYTVLYDGYENGVEKEMVLANCIRPKPPVVEFSDWTRGDLVHVFNNFAWKLATVLQVLEKKQFLVRVVGSRKDLSVGASSIRVRHYWQEDHWIIIGKGPSNSDVKRPLHRLNMISDSQVQPKNINRQPFTLDNQVRKRSYRHNSYIAPSMALKRNAPWTHNQAEAYGLPGKISRTFERSSPCTLNQTEACTGTATRSRLTEDYGSSCRAPATNTAIIEIQDDDSVISSVGSCSVNNDCSSHSYPTKSFKHQSIDDDASDAESSSGSTSKQRTQSGIYIMEKGHEAVVDRPTQHCSLVLRFRLQDPLLRGVAL